MTDLTDDQVKALLDGATPGPWQSSAAAEPLPFGVMPRIYSADGTLLAEVGDLTLDQDAWEANAHLMSAAPDLARALLTARAELARVKTDAAAAMALVVERAAKIATRHWEGEPEDTIAMEAAIRALASVDGLAAVDALRAEIADLKMNMDADLRTMVREGQQLRTLAAELAAAQQREAGLVERAEKAEQEPFQERVRPWMLVCFGEEVSNDRLERGDRLLEEVLELLQSGEYPKERVVALLDYVWSRPKGEPVQEVGGVMVTLAAYCLAHGIDMHDAAETELARIWTNVEKIRAKHAAKPKGSALPQAWPQDAELAAAQQREAVAYRDGWRFAYRQCLATGSVPDPDYKGGATLTPTEPGDGWTWNERLGWIGPDGKPAGRGGA